MKYVILLTSLLLFASADDGDVCEISACQALEQSQLHLREFADSLEDDNINEDLLRLERRLRALEQPGKLVKKITLSVS